MNRIPLSPVARESREAGKEGAREGEREEERREARDSVKGDTFV